MLEKFRSKLRDRMTKMSGYVLWPPEERPGVKGPQPRLITRVQAEAMRKMAEESRSDGLLQTRNDSDDDQGI